MLIGVSDEGVAAISSFDRVAECTGDADTTESCANCEKKAHAMHTEMFRSKPP